MLSIVSSIGLVLFMFVVGLELDINLLKVQRCWSACMRYAFSSVFFEVFFCLLRMLHRQRRAPLSSLRSLVCCFRSSLHCHLRSFSTNTNSFTIQVSNSHVACARACVSVNVYICWSACVDNCAWEGVCVWVWVRAWVTCVCSVCIYVSCLLRACVYGCARYVHAECMYVSYLLRARAACMYAWMWAWVTWACWMPNVRGCVRAWMIIAGVLMLRVLFVEFFFCLFFQFYA